MTQIPIRLTTGLVALAACLAFASCATNTQKSGYAHVVDYTTPKTNMSKEEFPFDADGEYREDYAARGAGIHGVKDKPADTAAPLYASNTTKTSTNSSSSNYDTGAGYTGMEASYVQEPDRPPTRSGSSSSSSAPRKNTTSSPRSSTASAKPKPKSKPRPKPVSKPTYVKVKSGDTLYAYSRKYGVSVDSIKAANGLKSDTIVDGKSLKIPKKK